MLCAEGTNYDDVAMSCAEDTNYDDVAMSCAEDINYDDVAMSCAEAWAYAGFLGGGGISIFFLILDIHGAKRHVASSEPLLRGLGVCTSSKFLKMVRFRTF